MRQGRERHARHLERQSGSPGSHYDLLRADSHAQVRVICWEDLAAVAPDPLVQRYISERLTIAQRDMTVHIADGWFRRNGAADSTMPSR